MTHNVNSKYLTVVKKDNQLFIKHTTEKYDYSKMRQAANSR